LQRTHNEYSRDRRLDLTAPAEIDDEFTIRNVFKLPRSFWLLVVAAVTLFMAFLPFIALGTYVDCVAWLPHALSAVLMNSRSRH